MYGPPSGYAATPPPGAPRSSRRQSAAWLLSATVTVLVAATVITLVLTGGGGTTPSSTPTPSRSGPSPTDTSPTAVTSTALSASPTDAPTTDVLPSNSGSGSCSDGVQPALVAVSVATVLGISTKGVKPNSYDADVLRDCTSASVRGRIELLFGIRFGTDYSADLTGGNDSGPSAQYRVSNAAGTGTLELTLTRQQDGHYEVTGFSYSG